MRVTRNNVIILHYHIYGNDPNIDFMKRIGTLRASFISTKAYKTLVLYGLVVKIAELCKNVTVLSLDVSLCQYFILK